MSPNIDPKDKPQPDEGRTPAQDAKKAAHDMMGQRPSGFTNAPAQLFIAEHTVAKDETLSHIALKYYGSAAEEKWRAIYEANKAVIGSNPGVLKAGQVLKIPKLPK